MVSWIMLKESVDEVMRIIPNGVGISTPFIQSFSYVCVIRTNPTLDGFVHVAHMDILVPFLSCLA
jgi:hypothetical protein